MYLKAVHYIAEAFIDKEIDPYERAYKIWWAKSFFVCWNDNTESAQYCITSQTLQDIICACDGLILYFQILKKRFPDAEIVSFYLGSDQNEQLFAFVRISFSGGRSRNIDAATLAFGMERRNVRSGLSLTEDNTAIAHTRSRTVLHPAVPLEFNRVKVEVVQKDEGVWTGSRLSIADLEKALNKATRDCIAEGKRYQFPVFMKVQNPDDRTGTLIDKSKDPIMGDDESDDEEVKCQIDNEDDEVPPIFNEWEKSSDKLLSTKIYGKVNFRKGENLLLNGGRTLISTKSRKSRFQGDAFGMTSDIRIFNQRPCNCKSTIVIGQTVKLPCNSNNKMIEGEVRYLSYRSAPLKFFCKDHSLIQGQPTAWLLQNDMYTRCDVP